MSQKLSLMDSLDSAVSSTDNKNNTIVQNGHVSKQIRSNVIGQYSGFRGCTIWFTGLSGAGKSTISFALEEYLCLRGIPSYVLDGDNMRTGLNKDLGFSASDCHENIRRVGEVAKLFADVGLVCLASFISPMNNDRKNVRKLHESAGLKFFECYVNTPLNVCESRDVKGLYKKERDGLITGLIKSDCPYEAPLSPDLTLKAGEISLEQCLNNCLKLLERNNILPSYLRLVGTESRVNEKTAEPYVNECSKDMVCVHLDTKYIHVNREAKQLHVNGRSELNYNIELDANGNETTVS